MPNKQTVSYGCYFADKQKLTLRFIKKINEMIWAAFYVVGNEGAVSQFCQRSGSSGSGA